MGLYIVEVWDGDAGEWREEAQYSELAVAVRDAKQVHAADGVSVRILKVEWRT